MLRSIRQLRGCRLGAIDGELGRVVDVFFDDQAWAVRYLVVDTHRWWPGRQVLISPSALSELDERAHVLPVALTKDQVRNSPDVSTHLPVSRQRENELAAYYGWPMYWVPAGAGIDEPAAGMAGAATATATAPPRAVSAPVNETDAHLRSSREVTGYHIMARDGHIGHVEDFLIDDFEWMIRYLVVDTRNFWPGRSVLISPQAVRSVEWADAEVRVNLNRDAIESAPTYAANMPVDREYEDRLHRHYGWGQYWV